MTGICASLIVFEPAVHDAIETRVEIVPVTPSYLRLESLVGTA